MQSLAGKTLLIAALIATAFLHDSCATAPKPELSAALLKEVRREGGAAVFRGSRLVVAENLPVLTLAGTPREMGLAYGVLLRGRLHEMMKSLEEVKKAVLASRSPVERALAPLVIRGYIRDMKKRIPGEFLDELRGVAEGAGIPEDDLVFASAGAGVFAAPAESKRPHCTSMLARLPGRIIHGRNFDFGPAMMGKHPVVVHYIPDGGIPYWNIGVIGYLPSFHGINEKGISVTLNYGVASFDPDAQGMPATYKIRRLLQGAATMEDARKILLGTPADEPGWIFTVASAEEGAGSVFDVMGALKAESGFAEPDHKVVLNRQFSPVRHPDGVLAKKALHLSDGEGEYNVARFESATRHLAARPVKSPDDMAAFLRSTDFYGREIPVNNNSTIVNDYTLQTLIFDWKERTLVFATGTAYSALHPMVRIDLGTGSVSVWKDADPRLSEERYRKFVEAMPETELHLLAGDRAWIAAHTDFAAADPVAVEYNLESWRKDPTTVPAETLIRAADRLIKQHPDYHLPLAIKAALVSKTDPSGAVALYKAALDAKINFVPNRIVQMSEIAGLYAASGNRAEAAAWAGRCLSLIREMGAKYVLDDWAVKIEKRMGKLAE